MIWLMAMAVSSTLFMEQKVHAVTICWIDNPQYIVLSSLLSFFLPGVIVVYLYIKIFKKLRNHQLFMFGQSANRNADKKQSLPRVIIEEVRSRRGSRLSQTGSQSGSPTRRSSGSKERSPSQPDIHSTAKPPQRLREEELHCKDDPIRKKSEEEVRKLSEERRQKILERRRMSSQENPNGIPIMQAFQKAYQDVRLGRRRSTIDYEFTYHTQLSTVCDEESSLTDNPSTENSLAEPTTAAIEKATTKSTLKDDAQDEAADSGQKPLLTVPPHHKQKNKPFSCIPPPTFLMVPAMMAINTPPQSPNIREVTTTLKVSRAEIIRKMPLWRSPKRIRWLPTLSRMKPTELELYH
ncbi:unnamed protein product [Nippostrongylus brasiliensis]|uniref:G_PROTEIN_RECEP_F1_2 domain-containing protein n=1 Tax=Nippostrongylus brasiliensis TaxID=27835 RepID=A0A158R263_NIPBR|nr:unnamed protein product [Nippostrongylus brasiliensis]